MRQVAVVGLCSLAMLLAMPAATAAGEDPTVSPAVAAAPSEHAVGIHAVTLAPSGAWVTRQLSVADIDALLADENAEPAGVRLALDGDGKGHLWLLGLPADMDASSVRVGGNRVNPEVGVRLEREVLTQTREYRRLHTSLAEAEADLREVRVQLEDNALRREIAREQLGALPADGQALEAAWAEAGPVARLLGRLVQARRAHLDRQAQVEADLVAIREQMEALRSAQPGWRLGIPLVASRDVGNETAPDAEALRVEYRVARAGWEPIYRVALDTESRKIDWRMTARVHQQTGEDWPPVPITLVTSDQRRFHPVPTLSPLTIGFVDSNERRPIEPMVMGRALSSDSPARAAEMQDATGFATEIAVNKPLAIPSGEGGVNLEVFEQRLDADIELRIAPQKSRDAVLVGRFEPSIVHPLPAGRWEIHRDGQQQAGISRPAIRPAEPVELSFGVDPRIVVEHEQAPDQRAGHGLIGKFSQIERHHEVTVTSRHEQALPVTVLLRMPTALDADIVVEPLPATSTPSRKKVDEQPGLWAYERKMAPHEPWEITFAYRVRWPEEKAISPF